MNFAQGQSYTRLDVQEKLGVPEAQRGGSWDTGYTRYEGSVYVFCNVGAAGRTGHDYANRWEGGELVWFGKTNSRIHQPLMRQMIDRVLPTHVFWRAADREPFTYAGVGAPISARDTSPVEVRWSFDTARALPTDAAAPLDGTALVEALQKLGFRWTHATKKVEQLQRGNIVVYVKRDTRRRPLIVHPRYLDLANELAVLPGVDVELPARTYINSNLNEFPVYEAEYRSTPSRHGLALGITAGGLAGLVESLNAAGVIVTNDGATRAIGTSSDPLTERERLAAARIGQGDFRTALIAWWRGTCPVAGVDDLRLLRASHIKPWNASSNHERLDPFNGVLLCAHIDALFDRGLVSFEDEGTLLISRDLSDANAQRLALRNGMAVSGFDARHYPYLAHHRAEIFRR